MKRTLAVPRGVELGYAEKTSTTISTTINTYEDIAGLSVTVTVGARPIIVEFGAPSWVHTAASALLLAQLLEGATVRGFCQQQSSGAAEGAFPYIRRRLAPSVGAHTYKVAWGSTTVGTHTMGGHADYPAWLQVTEV